MTWADPGALRLVAARLLSAADRQEQAGRRLGRSAVAVSTEWRGEAAGSALATLERLGADGSRIASACDEAAAVLLACAARLDDARALAERARSLEQQDAAERATATARGQFVPPYDSPLQQQARRLGQESDAVAAAASARAVAQLRELADAAPRPERLSVQDQVRAVGPAAVDTVWGSVTTVTGLSLPRLVVDPDGWLAQVRGMRDGIVYAGQRPGEAARAVVGWDLLQDGRYGEWVGTALPDAVNGVFSGGAVPMSRRTAGMAEELADLAEDVEDLQRVGGRRVDLPVETGGPVEPRPGVVMTERYPATVLDLEPERRRHILDGDPPEVNGGKGGGHRAGTGKGKSEFPASWSDDDIIRRVMDTARRPELAVDQADRSTMLATAVHEGVTIEVVVAPSGRIITAYPIDGPGVRVREVAGRAG